MRMCRESVRGGEREGEGGHPSWLPSAGDIQLGRPPQQHLPTEPPSHTPRAQPYYSRTASRGNYNTGKHGCCCVVWWLVDGGRAVAGWLQVPHRRHRRAAKQPPSAVSLRAACSGNCGRKSILRRSWCVSFVISICKLSLMWWGTPGRKEYTRRRDHHHQPQSLCRVSEGG